MLGNWRCPTIESNRAAVRPIEFASRLFSVTWRVTRGGRYLFSRRNTFVVKIQNPSPTCILSTPSYIISYYIIYIVSVSNSTRILRELEWENFNLTFSPIDEILNYICPGFRSVM